MSFGFNLSTKKEDVSTKLKTQNLKRAKQETRKLEHDGKKMEERLMELKMAMNREKEERERSGGGFWKTGQEGNLSSYADDVLSANKKKKSASGKTKIKILKDTPLDIPERNSQPGTVAYIANRSSHTPRDRPKGPKCGQCEERGAAVTCMQCSEDYCAGCFAAFHLKGNLKKHRSVPITATPRQCFASPRPNGVQTSSSYDLESSPDGAAPYMPSHDRKKNRNSPEGASGSYDGPNLLEGSYDESEQAASFQQALQAWRTGKEANEQAKQQSRERQQQQSWQQQDTWQQQRTPRHITASPVKTPRKRTPRDVIASPVKTPRVNVDTSTGTQENAAPIEIKFTSSNLSYADRLLLKNHRRTDVDALFTPRSTPSDTPSQTPRRSPRSMRSRPSAESLKIEEFNDDDFGEENRVDFHALFEAVQSTQPHSEPQKSPDNVSIVEVQGSLSSSNLEQTASYMVQEVGGEEDWYRNTQLRESVDKDAKLGAKPPTSTRSRKNRSARKHGRKSENVSSPSQLMPDDDMNIRIGSPKSHRKAEEASMKEKESPAVQLSSRLNEIESRLKKNEQKSRISQEEVLNDSSQVSSKSVAATSKSRPQSGKVRPQSGKSRPVSATKREQRRGDSRQGSRPSSRANSRLGSARSRAENPGILTKGPSDALASVARMTPTSEHEYRGMDSFFMAGVQPAEQEERTLTPTKHKHSDQERIKVSYQLYNMAPRSWKPDFSIADSIPINQVDNEPAEDDRASSVLAFHAISEQMVNEMTDRLVSRFGELPLQDDEELSDMSDEQRSSWRSGASLGEEYRTQSSMSLRDSPLTSARGTPILRAAKNDLGGQTPRGTRAESPSFHEAQKPKHSARGSRAESPQFTEMPKQSTKGRRVGRESFADSETPRQSARGIRMENQSFSETQTPKKSTKRNNMEAETPRQFAREAMTPRESARRMGNEHPEVEPSRKSTQEETQTPRKSARGKRAGNSNISEAQTPRQSDRAETQTPRKSSKGKRPESPSFSEAQTPRQSSRRTKGETSSRVSASRPDFQTPRQSSEKSRGQTPRQSSEKSRGQTPRASASRAGAQTPNRTQSFQDEFDLDRPLSRAIVMEGTDLSIFDGMGETDIRDQDDEETLDQLEWELASESGRLTADGQISRMEVLDDNPEDALRNAMETLRSMSRLGQDQGYDINSRLKESELEDENDIFFRHSDDDEDDVKNLM